MSLGTVVLGLLARARAGRSRVVVAAGDDPSPASQSVAKREAGRRAGALARPRCSRHIPLQLSYEPHFKGWHAPVAEAETPYSYWRGKQAVEIDPLGPGNHALTGRRQVTSVRLTSNGWSY
jgi:hypothetical protein